MLTNLRAFFSRKPHAPEPIPSGIYHYQLPPTDPRNYRFHLRIDPTGAGYLVLNAATILHLNQTAAEYAYLFIQQQDADTAASHIVGRYAGIRRQQARADYERFVAQLFAILETPDQDPTLMLGLDQESLFAGDLTAPYRLDCALTYQETPGAAGKQELHQNEWKRILDKSWQAGIPHILFTGGEPTLRPDLAELIRHAEANGQVTGLLTNGRRLRDSGYLKDLLQSGLDHTLVLLSPDSNSSWEAVASFQYWRNVLQEDIYLALHITVTPDNQNQHSQILDQVAEAGIQAVSLTAATPELFPALARFQEESGARGLQPVWGFPVPYAENNPTALDLETGQPVAPPPPGRASLYVDPDGQVRPAPESSLILGNLLTDEWSIIWDQVTKNFPSATQKE